MHEPAPAAEERGHQSHQAADTLQRPLGDPPFGHEDSGIAVRTVVGLAILLTVVVVTLVAVIDLSMGRWFVPRLAELVARPAAVPPPPRLQPNPAVDINALRREKETLLSTYQWTDERHAFARIPLDRAMALYVSQQSHAADKPTAAGAPP